DIPGVAVEGRAHLIGARYASVNEVVAAALQLGHQQLLVISVVLSDKDA
ncbi:MAG: hypothetical protein HYU44_08125, partial [Betaproteobacteria bacterium]|nr:hypothetical protein [Betaproteobacteria bacterium]